VKPDGRALDIAVVGLGQAGGNLAAELHRRGYRALALNTAQTDLAALDEGGLFPELPDERRLYVGLDGYDGAGADPAYGQDCLREHADRIRSAVLKQASSADAVVLCAGLGGGTGSSLSTLVEILEDESLPLVALMTLPTEGESGLAKVNAVRAVNEVVDASLLGWVFADNARIAELNPDVSAVEYFATINGRIIAPLDELNRLNSRDDLTPIRSFDGEDFRKLLLGGGVLNYAVTALDALTPEAVVGAVTQAVETSDLMPSGFDLARLSYLGLVIEAPESALAGSSMRIFESIASELKARTGGAGIYQGLYRATAGPVTLRLIASTQSLPHRMREILTDARREGQVLGEKVAEELPTLELGEITGFDLFRTKTRPSARPSRAAKAAQTARRPAELVEEFSSELEGKRTGPSWPDPADTPAPEPRPRPAPRAAPSGRDGAGAAESAPRPRRPRRRAEPSEPEPPPSRPAPGAPPPSDRPAPADIGTEEIDVVAALARVDEVWPEPEVAPAPEAGSREGGLGWSEPPISTDGVDTGDLPDPATYDQLVARYLNPGAPTDREDVRAKLEADASSEITVVRYYAVEAMAKLGRKQFGEALLRATEDDNEAVRSLAAEALRR
jgi:cell division GTPase FtsZ